MNDLRLLLILFGICLIAGIYIWGVIQARKKQRHQTIHDPSALNDLADLRLRSEAESDVDYSSALAGLNRSISASREKPDPEAGKFPAIKKETPVQQDVQFEADIEHDGPSPGSGLQIEDSTDAGPDPAPAKIVSLHIIPRGRDMLRGDAILSAAEQLELRLGEMQIFHHYGVGDMKMEKSLFSLANMVEPGNFDVTSMEGFATPGLVMFMCLPTIIDAQVVFELMLNTAQRMAEMLSADVCDGQRDLINEQSIESMRQSITT